MNDYVLLNIGRRVSYDVWESESQSRRLKGMGLLSEVRVRVWDLKQCPEIKPLLWDAMRYIVDRACDVISYVLSVVSVGEVIYSLPR